MYVTGKTKIDCNGKKVKSYIIKLRVVTTEAQKKQAAANGSGNRDKEKERQASD